MYHLQGYSLLSILCGVTISLSLIMLLTPNGGGLQAQNLGCTSYNFKCCRNIHYPVMAIVANTFDQSTCKTIDIMLRGQLANATVACKQAYVETYCLSAIPQCCPNQPVS